MKGLGSSIKIDMLAKLLLQIHFRQEHCTELRWLECAGAASILEMPAVLDILAAEWERIGSSSKAAAPSRKSGENHS